MLKRYLLGVLFVLSPVVVSAKHTPNAQQIVSDETESKIRTALVRAGLSVPVVKIEPSVIDRVYHVQTQAGIGFLMSEDATYLMQAKIETNPSPYVAIDDELKQHQAVGTPISPEYKAALLENMKHLALMNDRAVFYYTNVPNILWGMSERGGSSFLVSSDGRYFINSNVGAIFGENFIEEDPEFEKIKNHHVLERLDEEFLTIYPADNELVAVYVVTDIHCPYCRLLHSNISKYNAQGITVKVIGYPIYDESIEPMKQIWCQKDNNERAKSLTEAMMGSLNLGNNKCVAQGFIKNQTIAHGLDIFATPAIFNEQGELFTGDFNNLDDFKLFLGIFDTASSKQ